MKDLKNFKIPFKGLNLGAHQYKWDIDKTFFEFFDNQDIINCTLHISLLLEKTERMMELVFGIHGTMEVACDRCLGKLVLPQNISEKYYIKFGEERFEESEDVLIIPETDYQMDISSLIYEYIILSLPIKKVHEEDEEGNFLCDPETIKRLENENENDSADPRWDALKNIKLD